MATPMAVEQVKALPPSWAAIGRMASSVGEAGFPAALMAALEEAVRASDFMVLIERQGQLQNLFEASAYCQRGLQLLIATYVEHYPSRNRRISFRRLPMVDRSIHCNVMAIEDVRTRAFREAFYRDGRIVDHIWSVAPFGGAYVALSCLRRAPSRPFDEQHLSLFAELAPVLMPFVIRHVRMQHSEHDDSAAPLPEDLQHEAQQMLLSTSYGLAPREIEVCTRILRGMTSEAIALDLRTSIHTVRTQRKRAYAKMQITSMAELFSHVLGTARSVAGRSRH